MSADRHSIDDSTREQIVAYLDGELGDDESRAIESRLASDDSLRDEVQGLDRIWNALDDLPQATVQESFAKSTIEMVAVEAERQVTAMTAALPARRRRRSYAVIGACVGALLLGFALARAAVLKPHRQLLANLPVVYQVDALQNFSDIEFLRQVPQVAPNLLSTGDADSVAQAAAVWKAFAAEDLQERQAQVEQLSDNEKARLLDASRRYQRDLSPVRKQAVQSRYQQIAKAEDQLDLMHTALAYDAWLATKTASQQARMRELSTEDRIKELARLERKALAGAKTALSEEDSAALRDAVTRLADSPELTRLADEARQRLNWVAEQRARSGDRDQQDFVTRLSRGVSDWIKRVQKSPALSVAFLADVATRKDHNLARVFRGDWPETQQQAVQDWQVVEAQIIKSLSAEWQGRLQSQSAEQRRRTISTLVMKAARDGFESFDEEAFFASESLSNVERHELLALPSDQMQQRLRALYVQRQLGGLDRMRRGDFIRLFRGFQGRDLARPGTTPSKPGMESPRRGPDQRRSRRDP